MQRRNSLEVVELLTEAVGEAREPGHFDSHGKILAFDVGSRDMLRIRPTSKGSVNWASVL